MSRLLRTVLAALAILGVVVAAYAVVVGGPDGPEPQVVFEAQEATTPRGLAVAVIDHLGGRTVTSVAATRRAGLAVTVATDDPAVEAVSVFVGEAREGSGECGGDSGYTPVSCTTDGPVLEVVRRAPGGAAPTFIGRANDDLRGDVLVEVHGDSDAQEVADLVQALVEDPDLGLFTSDDRNTRGQDLDVVPLTFGSTLERVG